MQNDTLYDFKALSFIKKNHMTQIQYSRYIFILSI
jgi:hypothetical protein